MTLTVKATLAAMKMPLVVDDDQGIDLVLEKEEVEKRGGEKRWRWTAESCLP